MGEGSQFLEIVIFAMVAVFIILRLRSVLGRRTGHERPPVRRPVENVPAAAAETAQDNVVQLPERRVDVPAEAVTGTDDAVAAGLRQIRTIDAAFDVKQFLSGARTAYDMVLSSFASGDTDTLRALLDDDVYDKFRRAIADREAKKQTLETTLVALQSADVVETRANGRVAEVTVKFVAELVNVCRSADGELVSGDPRKVQNVTDLWTFSHDTRSSDPNWKLIATRSEH
ncbi:MAG: Tim44/TimA family putative adaptor protein [Alphaproteobacteria bacterium]|nr:Tim44/TimA family putative adaptor protein [Alphaproteobacteria bacterium]